MLKCDIINNNKKKLTKHYLRDYIFIDYIAYFAIKMLKMSSLFLLQ